jgi:hypothetical protein
MAKKMSPMVRQARFEEIMRELELLYPDSTKKWREALANKQLAWDQDQNRAWWERARDWLDEQGFDPAEDFGFVVMIVFGALGFLALLIAAIVGP